MLDPRILFLITYKAMKGDYFGGFLKCFHAVCVWFVCVTINCEGNFKLTITDRNSLLLMIRISLYVFLEYFYTIILIVLPPGMLPWKEKMGLPIPYNVSAPVSSDVSCVNAIDPKSSKRKNGRAFLEWTISEPPLSSETNK